MCQNGSVTDVLCQGARASRWKATTARRTSALPSRDPVRHVAHTMQPESQIQTMDINGESCAPDSSRHIRGAKTLFACMENNSCQQLMLTTSFRLKQAEQTIGKICSHSVTTATAGKQRSTMVAGNAERGRGMHNLCRFGSLSEAGSRTHAPAKLSMVVCDAG